MEGIGSGDRVRLFAECRFSHRERFVYIEVRIAK